MLAHRLFPAMLCLWVGSFLCTSCRESESSSPKEESSADPNPEPEPTGPTLESLSSDQGLLTLRFPNPPPNANAWVSTAGHNIFPKEFPVRIAVPLNRRVTAQANSQDEASFHTMIMLTPERREAEIVIHLEEPRHSERYGFKLSEIPKKSGFVPLPSPASGTPAAPVFLERFAITPWRQVPTSRHRRWFLVDERGDVWRAQNKWPIQDWDSAPDPVYQRMGRLETVVIDRMKALREDAVKGELVVVDRCATCYECGSWGLDVHGGSIKDPKGVPIAIGGQRCKRSMGPAAAEMIAWFVSLKRDVPNLEVED